MRTPPAVRASSRVIPILSGPTRSAVIRERNVRSPRLATVCAGTLAIDAAANGTRLPHTSSDADAAVMRRYLRSELMSRVDANPSRSEHDHRCRVVPAGQRSDGHRHGTDRAAARSAAGNTGDPVLGRSRAAVAAQ